MTEHYVMRILRRHLENHQKAGRYSDARVIIAVIDAVKRHEKKLKLLGAKENSGLQLDLFDV